MNDTDLTLAAALVEVGCLPVADKAAAGRAFEAAEQAIGMRLRPHWLS